MKSQSLTVAGGLVSAKLVPGVTEALVRSPRVMALLTANPRPLALILVHARHLVVRQGESRATGALGTTSFTAAQVLTTTIVHLTRVVSQAGTAVTGQRVPESPPNQHH